MIFRRSLMKNNLGISYYNKGLKNLREKKLSSSIECLKNSVALIENEKAYNLLGLCFWRMGKLSVAKQWFIKSLALEVKDNLAKDYLTNINHIIFSTNDDITKMKIEIHDMKNKKLLKLLLKDLHKFLHNTVYYNNIAGLVYFRLKNNKMAMEFWKKSININIEDVNTARYIAEIMNIEKKFFNKIWR